MPEENTSPGTGATPTPATGATPTHAPSSATLQEKPALTTEELLKRITDLEHSHKNATEEVERHRKKLSAYEKAEKEAAEVKKAAEQAQLSEVERITNQYQEAIALIKQQQQELVLSQIQLLAKEKGILNSELIAPFVERKLEKDKDGKPTNLEQVLDELIQNNRNLVQQAEPPPSPAQTAPAPTPPAVPAMNPGRASFTRTTNPTGQPPSWNEVQWSR
jgi:hypothetical protein